MTNNDKTILVVDDEQKVRLLLKRCFETENYRVVEAATKADMDAVLQQEAVDLITLDLQLGNDDGLAIAAALRATSNIPIIMVTGKGDVIDKVVGLEMGADDYISKPFHVREILARVKTVLRRSTTRTEPSSASGQGLSSNAQVLPEPAHSIEDEIYAFDGWQADVNRFLLTDASGTPCELTTNDFKLLVIFLQNARRVLSRDQIMDKMNGHQWAPYDRTIDNQIARLRKKIEKDPAHPAMVKTVRGIGYVFAETVSRLPSKTS